MHCGAGAVVGSSVNRLGESFRQVSTRRTFRGRRGLVERIVGSAATAGGSEGHDVQPARALVVGMISFGWGVRFGHPPTGPRRLPAAANEDLIAALGEPWRRRIRILQAK